MGGISISVSEYLIDWCINSRFSVMILFATLGAVCIVVSKILPESFSIPPPDMIPELMNKIKYQQNKVVSINDH
jgi:hypothetical protein